MKNASNIMKELGPWNSKTDWLARAKTFWSELSANGLEFHPDDNAIYIRGTDGRRLFTATEAAALNAEIDHQFENLGDNLYELVYDIIVQKI